MDFCLRRYVAWTARATDAVTVACAAAVTDAYRIANAVAYTADVAEAAYATADAAYATDGATRAAYIEARLIYCDIIRTLVTPQEAAWLLNQVR